jgi:CDGSH-type Zn-finger protein
VGGRLTPSRDSLLEDIFDEPAHLLARAFILMEARMAQVKITVRPNGPYRVEAPEGTIELVDANGTPYDLTGKPAFSLCRCGGSVNKPFCDGTHSKIGFQAAEAAVRAEKKG